MDKIPKNSKIYIAGHSGLVGSAVLRALQGNGYTNCVYRLHSELDLCNQYAVKEFFETEKPEYVVMCAAKVGGIHANNTYPWDFIYSNIMVQANVIKAAMDFGVKRLVFLASSCIYPRNCQQPMIETDLFSGALEPTNKPYAVAKLAGVEMCTAARRQFGHDFVVLIPPNMWGPHDNYHPENSHVIPGLLVKFRDAIWKKEKQVICWGSGVAIREFLYSDDFARAVVMVLESKYSIENPIMNVGSGREVTVSKLVAYIKELTGFAGDVLWNHSVPDGMPRKVMLSSLFSQAFPEWKPEVDLYTGLRRSYEELMAGTEI